jgi:SAM-dependent methyltransferase
VTASLCPVCGGRRTEVFLERLGVPAHQNVAYPSRSEALRAPRADLRMRACYGCGFAWNEAFDPSRVGYDSHYDNTQHHSPRFSAHMRAMADRVLAALPAGAATVVEIGCGKGDFLRLLVADPVPGYRGIGYDTTYEGPSVEAGGRLRFERRLFDRSCVADRPDAVVCRHVIEHISDPVTLLGELRAALGKHRTRVFFETPDVAWILENGVVWDFFHEHCSLFTPSSLARAFRAAGFTMTAVEPVFGGQYLWLEARPDGTDAAGGGSVEGLARSLPPEAGSFGVREREQVDRWRYRIESLAASSPVALWGAGAKGVTLAHLCDPDASRLLCLVDINPRKQGRYVAGTGHPIVAPAVLRGRGPGAIILLNPNYESEVRATMDELGLAWELVLP